MTQFVCLSGLPRSGSTILSAILNQNPLIHAEGNSAVCQLIYDMYNSFNNCNEQIKANNRDHTIVDLISAIPKIYYKDVQDTKSIIVDKCRSWTINMNVELLKTYIDPNIKIIVLERSVTDIVKSFMKLYKKNNWSKDKIHEVLTSILMPNVEPIMRSLNGINMAKNNNNDNTFLFIKYDNLISNPKENIDRIYKFCNWKPFTHDFNNIINVHPENDDFYNLEGFHDIRKVLSKEKNNITLPIDIMDKCIQIDKQNGYL